jgi:hypothetical protein
LLQRHLIDVSDRLKRLRAELAVSDEQCMFFEAEAEDARLRALVSETPLAEADARERRRHADAQSRHRDSLRRQVGELESEQNALLDRMAAELPTAPDASEAEVR